MGQILSKSAPLLNKEDLKHFYWLRISNLFLSPFFETNPEKQTLWIPSRGLCGEFSNISNYGSVCCSGKQVFTGNSLFLGHFCPI